MVSNTIVLCTICVTYSRDGLARVLGFTDCNTNQFCSEIGEDSGDHGTPQSEEAASITRTLVFFKCARAAPITEALPVAVWTTSERENEREDNHATNDQNLDRREPEFELSEEANTQIVDGDNGNEEYGNPNAWIDFVRVDPI